MEKQFVNWNGFPFFVAKKTLSTAISLLDNEGLARNEDIVYPGFARTTKLNGDKMRRLH